VKGWLLNQVCRDSPGLWVDQFSEFYHKELSIGKFLQRTRDVLAFAAWIGGLEQGALKDWRIRYDTMDSG
jgi:hypothetical protein